jgi:hypothetical protein
MIADRKLGACKVRKNIGAKLYTLVYNPDRHSIAYTYTEPIRQIWASSSNHSLFAFILWFAEDWLAFILTQLVRVVPNTNVAI